MAPESVAVPQRLFSDDYSATAQRAWLQGERGRDSSEEAPTSEEGPTWWDRYLGQLRFDSLVFRTLVVPDSHLLDGSFFLATRPRALENALARPGRRKGALRLPIEFRLRAPSLRETLARFLVVDDQDELNGFTFKTISHAGARAELAQQLEKRTREHLDKALACGDPAKGVAGLLRDCLREKELLDVAAGDITALEESWSDWIKDEEVIAPVCAKYRTNVGYVPAKVLKDERIDPAAEGLSDKGAAALEELVGLFRKNARRRWEFTKVLNRYRADDPNDETLSDLEELEDWVSRSRYRAIARQHRARFVQLWAGERVFGSSRRFYVRATSEPPATGRRAELPDGVLKGLADMPCGKYREFLTPERLGLLGDWWDKGDLSAFKEVAGDLGHEIASRRGPGRAVRMVLPPAAGLTGAIAGFVLEEPALALVGAAAGAAAQIGANYVPGRLIQRRIVDAARQTAG